MASYDPSRYSPVIAFLLWLADPEHPDRIRDWGHDPDRRGDLRDEFRQHFQDDPDQSDLKDGDLEILDRGDFAFLRNIASNKVAFFLVLMTAVPKPRRK